jgi:transposase
VVSSRERKQIRRRPMESRRRFSADEKLRIVLEGVANEHGVAEVCRRHGISSTQFYTWRKQLMRSAGEIFDRKVSKKAEEKLERLEEDLKRKDSVIAEITEENLELKKGLGGWRSRSK